MFGEALPSDGRSWVPIIPELRLDLEDRWLARTKRTVRSGRVN
jgi:hypothetical protein